MSALYPQALVRLVTALTLATFLAGCSPAYLWQAASGQMTLVSGREPVADVLADETLDPALRSRLELSQQALAFAHQELQLPDNGSYRTYYDTGSPYIVWNVFAAPEFSLEPETWCFPVTGCISYRGYFAEARARAYARKLSDKGLDVHVGGVAAYSTLGRFKDPVLNTMLTRSERDFVGLLFHELAHQKLYIKDDSAFNEGFATAVEEIGLQRWILQRGPLAGREGREISELQRRQVLTLMELTREQLQAVYESDLPDEEKRVNKAAVIEDLKSAYGELAATWEASGWRARPYQSLIRQGVNNASLGAIATYADYVPAFMRIYRLCEQSLECFYERSAAVGQLDPTERLEILEDLMREAPP